MALVYMPGNIIVISVMLYLLTGVSTGINKYYHLYFRTRCGSTNNLSKATNMFTLFMKGHCE